MKDRDNPIQTYRELFTATSSTVTLELGPNEFYDIDDRLGLFTAAEPEPHTWLTVVNDSAKSIPNGKSPEITIKLSHIRTIYERSVFTIMMILGELGGIYGALVGIPSFFISRYIEHQFISSFVAQTPIKDESSAHS